MTDSTRHHPLNRAAVLSALQRRFDRTALRQLQSAAARMAAENDDLRDQLAVAQESADFWIREATDMHLQLCTLQHGNPGLMMDGHLVVVQP